jgi:hypothetical protein
MHTRTTVRAVEVDGAGPTSWGIHTLNPRAARSRQKPVYVGLMPEISCMAITGGASMSPVR